MYKHDKESPRPGIYDKDGYRVRGSCVCFRNGSKQEVLLVTRRSSPGWMVPGGGVELNEEVEHAAIRELQEEAGVIVLITGLLGVFDNDTSKTRTTVFTAQVTKELDTWLEGVTGRCRQWFTVEQALQELDRSKPSHKLYIEKFVTSQNDLRT